MQIQNRSLNPDTQPREGMILCPVCKKEVAKGARTCPHCGKTFTTAGGVFIAIIVALVIGAIFFAAR